MENFRIKLDDKFFSDVKEATLAAESIFDNNNKNILQAVCNVLEENMLNSVKEYIINHEVTKTVINSRDPNNTLLQIAIRHCVTTLLIDYSYRNPKKNVLNIHLLNRVTGNDCVIYIRNFINIIIPFLKNTSTGEVNDN